MVMNYFDDFDFGGYDEEDPFTLDPLKRRRMANIVAPDTDTPGSHTGSVVEPRVPEPEQESTFRRWPTPSPEEQALMDGTPGEAYNEYMSWKKDTALPERKHSFLRALGAGLVGTLQGDKSGRVASQIYDAPYRNAVEDYNLKDRQYRNAANIEQDERRIKGSALRGKYTRQRQEEADRRQAERDAESDRRYNESIRWREEDREYNRGRQEEADKRAEAADRRAAQSAADLHALRNRPKYDVELPEDPSKIQREAQSMFTDELLNSEENMYVGPDGTVDWEGMEEGLNAEVGSREYLDAMRVKGYLDKARGDAQDRFGRTTIRRPDGSTIIRR